MTTLSFDAGYAMFQNDRAVFGRPLAMPAIVSRPLLSSQQAEMAIAAAGRVALALLPFSALAWMFIAR